MLDNGCMMYEMYDNCWWWMYDVWNVW